jgi:predicted aconitase with swiveling domain
MEEIVLVGRCISRGKAEGEAIVTKDPIVFNWGINPRSGIVLEKGHELVGQSVKGKILVFPHGKGSTGGSWVIYQMGVLRTGPKGMLCIKSEIITTVGAILANIPLVDKCHRNPLEIVKTGDYIEVNANEGIVRVVKRRR